MEKQGWMTMRTKRGDKVLERPFYSTNPRYIEVHSEWKWEPVSYDNAAAEIASLQLANDTPGSTPTGGGNAD